METNALKNLPVGVMDSGAGGIAVLRRAMEALPGEGFIYYGDTANAPYGDKTEAQIRDAACAAAQRLVNQGVKALLVACNTATAAAIDALRERYDMPVVGVEPALKPACQAHPGGTVAVMATPATLALNKYLALQERYAQGVHVIALPCPGLAALIERTPPGDPALKAYLRKHLGHLETRPDAVVIGCTHYSFIHNEIRAVLKSAAIFDGAQPTAARLAALLGEAGLLREGGGSAVELRASNKAGAGVLEAFMGRRLP